MRKCSPQIVAARVYEYALPLQLPLVLEGKKQTIRHGLLLELLGEDGKTGWGEAAPLPGFSAETYEAARERLVASARRLAERHPAGDLLRGDELPASVSFAVETALMDLGCPIPEGSNGQRSEVVPVNGLLSGTREEVLVRAEQLISEGFQVLKLKVGRQSPEADARLVGEVLERSPDGVRLRLDANRAWSYDQAVHFANGISPDAIEYIEEPLADTAGLEKLSRQTGCRIALDETLVGLDTDGLGDFAFAHAVVLKPTFLGGLYRSAAFARRARELSMLPVISAAYESGVGTRALATLSGMLSPGTAAGLDTYNWLAEDVLEPRIRMEGGRILLSSLAGAKVNVMASFLTRVV